MSLVIVEFWESNDLKQIIDIIKSMNRDVLLEFSNNGLTLKCLDTNHISIIVMKIDNFQFKQYHCENDVQVGINVNDFSILLRTVVNSIPIKLEISNNKSITITTGIAETKAIFNISTIDVDELDIDINNIKSDCKFIIEISKFIKIIRDFVDIKCEIINIRSINDTLLITGKNNSGIEKRLLLHNKRQIELNLINEIDVCFNLLAINDLLKQIKVNGLFSIGLSNENPLELIVHSRIYSLYYYISPLLPN